MDYNSSCIELTIFVLIAGIAGLMLSPQKYKPYVAFFVVILNSILSSLPSVFALTHQPIIDSYHLTGIMGNVNVRLDSLSAWFILIINLTVINGTLFGIGYLKAYQNLQTNKSIHWVFFILFHFSMLWVCLLENGFAFLVAWEIMSISSLMLVLFEYQKKDTLKAGVNYMIKMHISVALPTIGFIWLYFQTGSFDFSALGDFLSSNGSIWVFILLFAGFAIKAGFIPFHTWLPHAHPAAPSHVSGIMSGVIVKLGIYGIFRVISNLHSDFTLIGEIILILSVVTAIYGIVNAAVKFDFKKMLAYCTIENIGIIGIGIGVGLMGMGSGNSMLMILGFSGALLHTLNHSLFKSLLFFSAGSIYQQTHTRNIEKLGGLIKKMPQTALFFLIGALAIGGLPPFNGFISEFVIYTGLVKSLAQGNISQLILIVLSIAGLAIVGGMSLLTFTKNFGVIFTGSPRHQFEHEPKEVRFIMRLPQYIAIVVMLSVALIPAYYLYYASKVVILSFHMNVDNLATTSMFHTVSVVGWANLVFLALIASVFGLRWLATRNRTTEIQPTWGCGYESPVPKAQYTSKSFTRSFAELFSFLAIEKKKYTKIEKTDIFPKKRAFSSFYVDIFENYIINPITNRLRFATNYFQFIQNGKIQSYVLYGILFIVLVFVGTLFGLIPT
jgi:formate hydrogenlyase subunit 3/multisubunit Na+/H+ antiporter MnhD subunit